MPPRRIYYQHCVAAITADSIKNQRHKLPFKKTVIKILSWRELLFVVFVQIKDSTSWHLSLTPPPLRRNERIRNIGINIPRRPTFINKR